jgi:hypothetical protein
MAPARTSIKEGAMDQPYRLSEIQDLQVSDMHLIQTLNNAHASETSHLGEKALASLLAMCFYARGIDRAETAILLALDQSAPYLNPNFNWFKDRRQSFVYIDRVIVAPTARGQGIAARLYRDLFARAVEAGHRRVVCEINVLPPNPASDAFHGKMGFQPVGEAAIHNGAKTVRYFEKVFC